MSKQKNQASAAKNSGGKPSYKLKSTPRQTAALVILMVVLVAAFLGVWMRTIANGYFGSYVARNAQIDGVMQLNSGRSYTAAEERSLMERQRAWDAFRASNLRDAVGTVSGDGTALSGWFYDQGGETTVLVLRQYNETAEDDFLFGTWFTGQGYNLLLPDSRAHGGSEGAYTGFGYLEQADVLSWLSWLEGAKGTQTVVIYGQGMGANAALFCAGAGTLPENVAFVVAESPFDSLKNMAEYTLKTTHRTPYFPFGYGIEWKLAWSRAGYRAEDVVLDADTLAQASVPVLFLGARLDDYLPIAFTQAVYDAYPAEKELFTAGCRHGLLAGAEWDSVTERLEAWSSDHAGDAEN